MLARKLLSEEGWWLSDEGYAELGVDRGSSARDARARALVRHTRHPPSPRQHVGERRVFRGSHGV